MQQYRTHATRGMAVRVVSLALVGILLAVVFGLAFGYFVMLLWNWLMPGTFGLKTITYWQAAGLVLLVRLLFGSGRGEHGYGPPEPGEHAYRRRLLRLKDKHGPDYWKHYDAWWKSEGQQVFQEYVERLKKEGQ